MNYTYEGNELSLFMHADRWKAYWSAQIAPFIRGDVLEVGAGLGANTTLLRPFSTGHWTCLDPDEALLEQLATRVSSAGFDPVELLHGTVASAQFGRSFDTILYIDVLEHIEDDRGELERVCVALRPRGCLIVLSPAHEFLFSPFDAAIGHHRRYDRKSLLACSPQGCHVVFTRYLDACGMVLSMANRLLLKQSCPTSDQIQLWDSRVVPVSRIVDGVLGYQLGKTIIAVWQKQEEAGDPCSQ